MKKIIGLLVLSGSLSGRVENVPESIPEIIKELKQDLYHLPSPETEQVSIRCTYTIQPWALDDLLPTLSILNNELKQNNYNQLLRNRVTGRRAMEVIQQGKRTLERLVKMLEKPSTERTEFLSSPESKKKYDEIVDIAQFLIDHMNPDPTTGIIDYRVLDDHINTEQPKLERYVNQIRKAHFLNKPGTITVKRHIGKQTIDMRQPCNELAGKEYYPWIVKESTKFKLAH